METSSRLRKTREDVIEKTSSQVADEISKTLVWTQLLDWQKDNEYILTGYRRVQNSWRGCVESVFGYLHNETVNIYSHLFGAILFIWLLFTYNSVQMAKYSTVTWIDYVMFTIFLCSAVFCLASSAIFHMAGCHSEQVCARSHAFDYAGIIVLIMGSFSPCVYYGFFCDLRAQLFYITLITIAGGSAAYIVLSPIYSKPSHRGARTKVFIALGLCAVLPVTHGLYTYGVQKLNHEMGFKWLVLSGALYICGALLYANRIPECLYPGRFDYFFASHQIFHVHVVLAALAHYLCLLTAFGHWHGQEGGVCPT